MVSVCNYHVLKLDYCYVAGGEGSGWEHQPSHAHSYAQQQWQTGAEEMEDTGGQEASPGDEGSGDSGSNSVYGINVSGLAGTSRSCSSLSPSLIMINSGQILGVPCIGLGKLCSNFYL